MTYIYKMLINVCVIIRRWMGADCTGQNMRQLTTTTRQRIKPNRVSRCLRWLSKLRRNQFQTQWQCLFALWFRQIERNRCSWIWILQKTKMNIIGLQTILICLPVVFNKDFKKSVYSFQHWNITLNIIKGMVNNIEYKIVISINEI